MTDDDDRDTVEFDSVEQAKAEAKVSAEDIVISVCLTVASACLAVLIYLGAT